MKRWVLWNFRCLRGRRCADIQFTELSCPVPGAVLSLGFECDGCGTRYERSAVLGNDGNFTQTVRAIP